MTKLEKQEIIAQRGMQKKADIISQLRSLDQRDLVFLAMAVIGTAMLSFTYYQLVNSVVQRQYYSHLIFIPLISAYFGYQVRAEVSGSQEISVSLGLPVAAAGMVLSASGWFMSGRISLLDAAALANIGAVVFILGGFVTCYGFRSFRQAMFPLLFLLFAVPLPSVVMHNVIQLLQAGTSAVADPLFRLTGVPFVREGNFFYLESISVEVAEECSGIRSSLSLIILSVLAGKMILKSRWRRVILSLSVIPITIFKNGVRVVTLSLLGAYVDPRILTNSAIHSNSGLLIFILPLTLLGLVLWLLKRSEKKADKPASLQAG
jgi:exosortase